jgi:hypothetical protein
VAHYRGSLQVSTLIIGLNFEEKNDGQRSPLLMATSDKVLKWPADKSMPLKTMSASACPPIYKI